MEALAFGHPTRRLCRRTASRSSPKTLSSASPAFIAAFFSVELPRGPPHSHRDAVLTGPRTGSTGLSVCTAACAPVDVVVATSRPRRIRARVVVRHGGPHPRRLGGSPVGPGIPRDPDGPAIARGQRRQRAVLRRPGARARRSAETTTTCGGGARTIFRRYPRPRFPICPAPRPVRGSRHPGGAGARRSGAHRYVCSRRRRRGR